MNKKVGWLIVTVVVLISAMAIAYWMYTPSDSAPPVGLACSPESRLGEVCTALYQPVCGWFNGSRIQCIRYPCAQTYGNSCEACHNPDVEYYTVGECPQ